MKFWGRTTNIVFSCQMLFYQLCNNIRIRLYRILSNNSQSNVKLYQSVLPNPKTSRMSCKFITETQDLQHLVSSVCKSWAFLKNTGVKCLQLQHNDQLHKPHTSCQQKGEERPVRDSSASLGQPWTQAEHLTAHIKRHREKKLQKLSLLWFPFKIATICSL